MKHMKLLDWMFCQLESIIAVFLEKMSDIRKINLSIFVITHFLFVDFETLTCHTIAERTYLFLVTSPPKLRSIFRLKFYPCLNQNVNIYRFEFCLLEIQAFEWTRKFCLAAREAYHPVAQNHLLCDLGKGTPPVLS